MVTGALQPETTEPLSKKKNAVAANVPIEIIQKEIPTKSSADKRTISSEGKRIVPAFAATAKHIKTIAVSENVLNFLIKKSI